MTHTATLHHTKKHWPVALGLTIGLAALDPVAPSGFTMYFLPMLAGIYLVFGAARGHLRRPGVLSLQLVGLAIWSLLAVVAIIVDPAIGRYVVAAGWLGHAFWDAYHLRKDSVVPAWYAKACIVADLLVGTSLLVS
jgi:hypothetical protein